MQTSQIQNLGALTEKSTTKTYSYEVAIKRKIRFYVSLIHGQLITYHIVLHRSHKELNCFYFAVKISLST